jgi:hypothetical protein
MSDADATFVVGKLVAWYPLDEILLAFAARTLDVFG